MLCVRGVLALSPVALSPESGVTVCVIGIVSMWLLHCHRLHGSHHELMSSHHNSLLRGFLLLSFDSANMGKPALSLSAVRQLSSLPPGSADTAALRYSTIASTLPPTIPPNVRCYSILLTYFTNCTGPKVLKYSSCIQISN